MAVMAMQKVGICALNKNRKKILEELQERGWMQIDEEVDPEKEFDRIDTSANRTMFTRYLHQAERAIEILDLYAPVKKGLFAGMQGKTVLDRDIYEKGAEATKDALALSAKLADLDRDITALKAENSKLTNQMEELIPWERLDVPMDYAGTSKSVFFVGTIAETVTERQVETMITEQNPNLSRYCVTVISSTQDMTYLAVVALREEEKPIEDALRKIGFSRPSNVINKTPKEARDDMQKQISANEKEIEALTGNIKEFSPRYEELQMFADYIRIRTNKYEVLGTLPQTKNVFAVEGYVPKAVVPALTESMSKYDAVVESRDLTEDEDPPVLFRNTWFGAVGEGTVASFGLPNKKEFDPSFIMTIFYVIFFGLMLSDAAYGAILSLGTGIMLLKFPRMEKGMKNLLQLFFLCGFSTIFWGVMFGGYFGDAFDVIARTFVGVDLPQGQAIIPAVWFVPISEPMRMLVYSMLFGLIHMYVGLIIGACQSIKNKEIGGFLTIVGTGLFVLGLILFLVPTDLFAGIAGMQIVLPPVMGTLTPVITIVGLACIIIFASDAKNPLMRILLGVYEVYNITIGWLSDTLSYSRLLALGLATGVIAQVFNQLGTMFGGGVLGAILFIVVFLIGHVFNLAINVLGAYVHTCRLQYVEFFGKFYEGGGKKFEPFFADTKYVEVKGGQ